MAIRHTSDSMARCDPQAYSNIYDVRARPEIKKEPVAATQPIKKDTLEISRDQLKKEALNRLRHTSKYLIFQTGFMRVGKFLFLAVAFPPYFVIYGIPKWILVQGLPALMSICVAVAEKVKQKVKKRVEVIQQKVRQVVLSIQQIVKRLISPILRLAMDISRAFQRMRHSSELFVKRLTDRFKARLKIGRQIKEGVMRPIEKFSRLARRLQAQAQNGKVLIQEWAANQINHLQTILAWAPQLPQWGAAQLQRLAVQAGKWGQDWKGRFNTSQDAARKSVEWLAEQLSLGKQAIKKLFKPTLQIYHQLLKPAFKQTLTYLRDKKRRAQDFLGQKRRRALQFLQSGQEKLNKMTFQHVIDWSFSVTGFSAWPAFLQKVIRKVIGNRLSRFTLGAIFKIFSSSAIYFLKAVGFAIRFCSQAMYFLSKNWGLACGSIRLLFRKTSHFSFKGLNLSGNLLKKGVYTTLLFAIMLSIIMVWSFQLLGDLMHKLLQALPFKSAKVKSQDAQNF